MNTLRPILFLYASSLFVACQTSPEPFFDPSRDRYELGSQPVKESTPTTSLPTSSPDLDLCLRLTLKHNPQLKSLAKKIDQASARRIQAELWPNPTLNLGSEEGPLDNGLGFDEGKLTAGLSQTLPITGILAARQEAANKSKDVALLQYEVAVRQLIGSTRRAYLQALLAQRFVNINQANLLLAKELLKKALNRVQSGAASETEQFRAEIEVAESQVALRGAEASEKRAVQNLLVLIAHPQARIEKLKGELPEAFPELHLPALQSKILSEHPRLILAQKNIESAGAQLRVAQKSWLPQPTVQVAMGRSREDEVNTVFEWGVSIPLPFFNRNQGTIAAQKAQIRQFNQDIRSVQNQLLGRLKTALILYRQQRQQVKDYKERIVPLAQKSLILIQKQQNLGKLSQIDVLDAQRTVFRAKRSYLTLLQQLVSTAVEIEQLAGEPLKRFAK